MGAQYVAAAVGCLELGPKPGRHSLCAELKLLSSQLPLINPQLTASLDCGGMRLLRLKDCTLARLALLRLSTEQPREHSLVGPHFFQTCWLQNMGAGVPRQRQTDRETHGLSRGRPNWSSGGPCCTGPCRKHGLYGRSGLLPKRQTDT